MELNLQRQQQRKIAELIQVTGFKVQKLFQHMDKKNQGYLDSQNIRDFLKKKGHNAKKDELVSIIRRVEKSDKGTINLSELQNFLL